jgi:hypothetical protein
MECCTDGGTQPVLLQLTPVWALCR